MRTGLAAASVALSIGSLLGQDPASAQEYRGTYQQQMACTPDVWRLCSDQVPDVNRIVACLRQNVPQLSSGCRAVFTGGSPNGRIARARPPAAEPPPYAMRPEPPPGPYYPGPYYDEDY